MKKIMKNIGKKFVNHIRRTYKNKIWAVGLVGLGWISTKIDGDGTFFLITLFLGTYLMFAKENAIEF